MDFAKARMLMVDGQLRPSRVVDPALLAAYREVPREAFLPASLGAWAYADEDVALGQGRVLAAPLIVARLLQLAEPRAGDRALIVGAGAGYGATILARCGVRVTALESDPALIARGRAAVVGLVPVGGLRFEEGPLPQGWVAGAPYDVIVIEGEVPSLPDGIVRQLAEGGRLVTVLGEGRGRSRAVLARRIGGALSTLPAHDCATTPLPAFKPAPAFQF